MATSEQLERQAEFTRAQIADSLAELRDRMTPGQVMDETLDYFRDGRAGQFVRNLRVAQWVRVAPCRADEDEQVWALCHGRCHAKRRSRRA